MQLKAFATSGSIGNAFIFDPEDLGFTMMGELFVKHNWA